MSKISDIIGLYTKGEKTYEEVNALLKEEGVDSFHLDPTKNQLTAEEIAATVVSEDPDEVSGYGLLDSGTGSYDKVKVEKGTLVNCDCGEMYALVLIGGMMFEVDGTELVPYGTNRPATGTKVQKTLDMSRRKDLANQVVEQVTARGTYEVHYDKLGYAVKAIHK